MNKKDLTRWNRSGLKAFRYIDGNAITYLETLRLALNEEYNANSPPQWQELVSRFPQLANESPLQKNKRITDQYYDERRDFAWEILRSFARSVHVLGEYINAYANEAYLPTAIEWDNVRKLVALLGYQPSPPSSAMTSIALLLKPGQSGEINRGFAIKNKPAKGAATIIFETQEKMKGHALINTMRLKDWNRNPQTIKTQKQGRFRNIVFELPQLAKDINIGDQGVLVAAKKGYPIEVISMKHKKHNSRITLRARSKMPKKIALADTTLYLQPQFIEKPLPNGKGSASLSAAVNLADGEVVISGKSSSLAALKVVQAKQKLVLFEPSTFNENDSITRALISKKQHLDDFPKIDSPANDFFILNDVANKDKVFVVDEKLNPVSKKIEKEDSTNTFYIEGKNLGDTLYYTQKPLTSKPLATVINVGNATVTSLQFSGKASELTSGQWLWVKHKNGKRAAYQISKIKQQQDQFHLTLPSTKAVALIQS
ncbi:MAG TPA: hypothetical protein ENJ41_03270, partial [Oceanospirillales bacterium]|nr:hypothetical protein [Oceanospirillales bacterium]